MEQFLNYHLQLTPALPDIIKEMGNEEVVASVSSSEADLGIIFYSYGTGRKISQHGRTGRINRVGGKIK